MENWDIKKNHFGEDNIEILDSLIDLATIFKELGDLETARVFYMWCL